jgi:hypothetical protein
VQERNDEILSLSSAAIWRAVRFWTMQGRAVDLRRSTSGGDLAFHPSSWAQGPPTTDQIPSPRATNTCGLSAIATREALLQAERNSQAGRSRIRRSLSRKRSGPSSARSTRGSRRRRLSRRNPLRDVGGARSTFGQQRGNDVARVVQRPWPADKVEPQAL